MTQSKPIIVITGASRGIGAATARLAARRGYAVCVNYRADERSAHRVVDEIERDAGQAFAVQADVSNERDVQRLFECADAFGPLAALVNNAGILAPQSTIGDMDAARLQAVFATNVFGTMLCAREAVARMSTNKGGIGGAIVNVSSAAARTGSPGEYVDYAASKGAIDTFTRGLALEVADQGIRVNAVRPGYVQTDIHASAGEPDRVKRLATSIPLGRGGQAHEVANAILWLLSDEAAYSTGTFIDVAGGR